MLVKLKELYAAAKDLRKGEEAICPSCKASFVKAANQQAFCKTKEGTRCKDYYWNNVTETKRNNTTRISPANAAWTAIEGAQQDARDILREKDAGRSAREREERLLDNDPSWDAHNCFVGEG